MRLEKDTSRTLTRNCAIVMLVSLLLVASTVIIPQGSLYNKLFPSAYAQQAEEGENGQQEQDRQEALLNLRALLDIAPGRDLEGVLGDLIEAEDPDGIANAVGASDSSELTQNPRVTDSEGLVDLARLTELDGLLDLVGLDLRGLLDLLNQRPSATDPTTQGEEESTTQGEEESTTQGEEEPPNPPSQGGGVDRFGIEQLYETASGGPTWYIQEQEDPTSDGHFYYGMYRGTTVDYSGNGVWHVNALSGTEAHGIRMHVDSPSGTWKNTEMTAYFRVLEG